MTQPSFVPITDADQVRPAYRLRTPPDWRQDRVAELRSPDHPRGRELGVPGPDQGYALTLARRFEDRLVLTEGEDKEDVTAGCLGVATKRSSLFGRAPVIYDLELAFTLFGFLTPPPEYLVEFRRPLFEGARDDYWDQRGISDLVPEETLRLTPQQVRDRLPHWREMLTT